MKQFRLRLVAGSRHAALNICSVDPKATLAARASQPLVRSRVRSRFSCLALGASVVWGLCAATSLHAQSAPHGDHNPHHGGVVLMYGLDLHYEVVLTSAGNVELWLSNAVREDLPASVVSDVAAEIEHAGARRNIDMTISESGDAWVGKADAVKPEDTTLHLGFVYRGESAALSFPAASLMGTGRESLVKDAAHAPTAPPPKSVPSNGHQGHEGHSMGGGGPP